MLGLVRDPRNELHSKKSLRKSSFDEINATLRELFPTMQDLVGKKLPQLEKMSQEDVEEEGHEGEEKEEEEE
ncbi:hypothetical protein E2C01_031867 [Portunus trituberculatus]|uniref:Uncharacterized protein n=1 Tax=Portunus trituberculatus TaxID=210409 RepID=A0A5B7EUK2_PORTR|nr:hypothetical protein [Portunus trituberculatus]